MSLVPLLILLTPFHEQYSLPPSNATQGVRLVISVPEPLEQSMVGLHLEATDGGTIATRDPILISQETGWRLHRGEADQWMLTHADPTSQEIPGIQWSWRHEPHGEWHASEWANLFSPAPLAPIPSFHGDVNRSTWLAVIVAEGMVCLLLASSISIWRRYNHPANRLQRELRTISARAPYWTALHQFIREYLKKTWRCQGNHVIQQWHAQRHDSGLGKRLELLLEATAEARFGAVEIERAHLPHEWFQWLTDAEKSRLRRL